MMRFVFLAAIVSIFLTACIEPYAPEVNNANPNYLVVDGFLNATDGSIWVTLTRTVPLASGSPAMRVSDAYVALEDDASTVFDVPQYYEGVYVLTGVPVNLQAKYRIRIITDGGLKQYTSEFITLPATPPIDTLTWNTDNDQLNIFASTVNSPDNGRYYRWNFIETYEYGSPIPSMYTIKNGSVISRPQDEMINQCWRTDANKRIITGTTTLLSENTVSNFKVLSIPRNSIKISLKYSALIQMQSLTPDAYNYWSVIEKNTESVGGLFDPLPGQAFGNISCVTNRDETVIGYFDGGMVSEKRIFIRRTELPKDFLTYSTTGLCKLDTLLPDTIPYLDPDIIVTPISPGDPSQISGIVVTQKLCTDCRLYAGGTLRKPDFWEE